MQSPIIRSLASNIVVPALGIILLAFNAGTQAHTFCVTNAADLQAALNQSSDGGIFNNEPNSVNIVAGAYLTNGGPFTYNSTSAGDLFIQGGFHDALCTSPTPFSADFDSKLSILDGHNASGVMKLRSTNGEIFVNNLTFQNGESTEPGGGLQVNYGGAVNKPAIIGPNIFRDNHTSSYAGGLYVYGAGTFFAVTVYENVIVNNKSESDDGGAYVLTSGTVSAIVQNNTIANNMSVTGPIGGLRCGGSPGFNLYNNIVWGNSGTDIYLAPGQQVLYFNDYGTLVGPTPFETNGNLSSNPRFIDSDVGNFHLAGNSPALGISWEADPWLLSDVEGKAWPRNGRIDLGAYEETIFVDGNELY
jgi:hypothetical protein